MAFFIHFMKYAIVIFWASFLVILAFRAKSSIHASYGREGSGGVDIIEWM